MPTHLTDPTTVASLLQQAGIVLQKTRSQNFLICDDVIEKTLATVIQGPLAITELGAGLGTVTIPLLKHGFRVKAIEQDRQLTAILASLLSPEGKNHLTLLEGDLRVIPWEQSEPYQVVGNIPYHLSGLILRRITELTPSPNQAILLVQKEVGQRLTATPPHMHLLSVAVQLWGDIRLLQDVPATCFFPPPQVDSQLLYLTPHAHPLPLEQREMIIRVAKLFFQQRRKQMAGVLQKLGKVSLDEAKKVLTDCHIEAQQRPQELSLQQWRHFSALLSPRGVI